MSCAVVKQELFPPVPPATLGSNAAQLKWVNDRRATALPAAQDKDRGAHDQEHDEHEHERRGGQRVGEHVGPFVVDAGQDT